MTDLPVLDLGPDPFERGVVQGRTLAASIRANLETYFNRFAMVGSDRATVLAAAGRWQAFIAEDNADYAIEMAGIAKGAGLSLDEITVLNARYELTYEVYSIEARRAKGDGAQAAPDPQDMPEQEGCTLFGLMPDVTASGACVIGQNWDWLAGLAGNCFIKRVHRDEQPELGKPAFVGFSEAGIVGCKMGVNQAGVGLCIAGLVTAFEGQGAMRKPVHVRCAEILDAWRFSEALRPVLQTDRTCSSNFMIGHGDGEIIDIEATTGHAAYLYPQDGVVTHSNNLVAERRVASQIERIAPSTLFRAERVRRHMKAQSGRIDLDVIRAVMSDHFSAPASVCMHADPKLPAARRNATIASVAIDLTNKVLYATNGNPCHNPFRPYPLAPATAPADAMEMASA
ncbi:C45 family autoproteolytic acyltransferase/hydrolase [Tistrella bauzanensis]|uniref:C45 family peptidase n=1 Tax=Tistrella arctica TaxID=3133430 RepID=A0ABU9YR37_9PROT